MNCPHCQQEIDLHQHDAEEFRKGWQAGNKAGMEVREPLVKALEECVAALDTPQLRHARASKRHVDAWKHGNAALAKVKEGK